MFRLMRFLLLIPFMGYCAYSYYRDEQNYQRNKQPEEWCRHARSIESAWTSGVFARSLPLQTPAKAEEFLQSVLRSDADAEVKVGAEKQLESLRSYPHYFRLANHLTDFADEFDSFRSLIAETEGDPEIQSPVVGAAIKSKFLVVTPKRHGSAHPGPQDDSLYFDPDMVEALGDAVAVSPAEVRTVISLLFLRMKTGDYRLHFPGSEEVVDGPAAVSMRDAFVHLCDALVIDVASRSVVGRRRFVTADPEKMEIDLLHSSKPLTKDGYEELRTTVQGFIRGVAAAATP